MNPSTMYHRKSALSSRSPEAGGRRCSPAARRSDELSWDSGLKPVVCSSAHGRQVCARTGGLRRHLALHTGKTPFVCFCETCAKRFAHSGNFALHRCSHSRKSLLVGTQKSCGQASTRLQRPLQHESSPVEEMFFVCFRPGCGQKFLREDDLRRHAGRHITQRLFVCAYRGCAKAFEQVQHLLQHRRIHAGPLPGIRLVQRWTIAGSQTPFQAQQPYPPALQKSFVCQQEGCRRRFTTSKGLAIHGHVHTRARPFPCPHRGCSRWFVLSEDMDRHLATHEGRPLPRREAENHRQQRTEMAMTQGPGAAATRQAVTRPLPDWPTLSPIAVHQPRARPGLHWEPLSEAAGGECPSQPSAEPGKLELSLWPIAAPFSLPLPSGFSAEQSQQAFLRPEFADDEAFLLWLTSSDDSDRTAY